jgi:hypothetical protein
MPIHEAAAAASPRFAGPERASWRQEWAQSKSDPRQRGFFMPLDKPTDTTPPAQAQRVRQRVDVIERQLQEPTNLLHLM